MLSASRDCTAAATGRRNDPPVTVDAGLPLRITQAIERALGGGESVAVATVTAEGAPGGPTLGAKLLVRLEAARDGSLGVEAIDIAVERAAREQMGERPRTAVQTLWVVEAAELTNRRSQAAAGAATIMVEVFEAPARLVIVGGGHIGLALAQFGEAAGFAIAIFDDREDFANRDRFPMAERVVAGALDANLDEFELQPADYVVMVSRGHQQDELALRHVIGREAGYVGMIGSKRRVRTVLENLAREGVDIDALEAVRTPIGIDIGAETPEEIAVSILAEIILERRGGSGTLMRESRQRLRVE